MLLDPTLFEPPLSSQKNLWVSFQAAYIVVAVIYCYFVIPNHVVPLIRLACRGHCSKLVVRTSSFDIYSNTAGYSVGSFTKYFMRFFLVLFGLSPILIAFMVTPIFFLVSLFADYYLPRYQDWFPLLPSSLLPLFFLNHGQIYSLPNASNTTRAAIELAQNAIISSAIKTGSNPFKSSSKIMVNLYTIKWLMIVSLVSWLIHIFQVFAARSGFYSELSVSQSWTKHQSHTIKAFASYTPFSIASFASGFLALVSCILYFISNNFSYSIYFYGFLFVSLLTVIALIFAIFASFGSIFELKEQIGVAWDKTVNQNPSPSASPIDNAGIVDNTLDHDGSLQNHSGSVARVPSAFGFTAPITLPRTSCTDEAHKLSYRGFMTLDPNFLCDYSNLIAKSEDHQVSKLRKLLRRWNSLFSWVWSGARHSPRRDFDDESRLYSRSNEWIDQQWLVQTMERLQRHSSHFLGGQESSANSSDVALSNHFGCSLDSSTSSLMNTLSTSNLFPLNNMRLDYNKLQQNQLQQLKHSRRLKPIPDILCHTKLLVAFKKDVGEVSTRVEGGLVGFGASPELIQAVKQEMVCTIKNEGDEGN